MAKKTGTATRPRTERRNRDDSVMAVAIKVMSERGYSATSVQEVADRVGVLKGSLYHYFSSKEELLFRIVEESHLQTVRIEEEITALGLTAFEELLEFVRRHSLWYVQNPERANIFFSDRRHLTGDREKASNEWGRHFERHIQSLVSAAQDAGDVRTDLDERLVTRYVLGALNNVRTWPTRPGKGKRFAATEMSEAMVSMTRSALQA